MISLKKSFVYKDLCYLMSLWSVKLPTLGQASRISGVNPADLVVLKTHLNKTKKTDEASS